MFKPTSLLDLENKRNKAFAVFNKVKDDLFRSIELATEMRENNQKRLLDIQVEMEDLKKMNAGINQHIDKVHGHITQIETIIQ